MKLYTASALLKECQAIENETNKSIANVILTLYMQSKNLLESDCITLMKDFLQKGNLNLSKHNLQF